MDTRRTDLALVAQRLAQPETLLVLLAFAFHTTWEFLQDPLYAGLAASPHAQVRAACLKAAAGDVGITLAAFYAAAFIARSRLWFVDPNIAAVAAWFITGLLITIAIKGRANASGAWRYGPSMPIVPILRVGMAPLAQWIVIPAILLVLIDPRFDGIGRNGRKTL